MDAFDEALKAENWPLNSVSEVNFKTSRDPCQNAALVIALCAYPQGHQITKDGKAAKYYFALLAYLARVEKMLGVTKRLPKWARDIKPREMQKSLDEGLRHLERNLVFRQVIYSAVFDSIQNRNSRNNKGQTFSLGFSPDMESMAVRFSLMKVNDGYVHRAEVPESSRGSLWQSVIYHLPAIRKHMGAQTSSEARDDTNDCQNIFNRYLNPIYSILPILNLVWAEVEKSRQESIERHIAIDQILMRHALWARDVSKQARAGAATAVHVLKHLGVPFCDCRLVRLYDPECAS